MPRLDCPSETAETFFEDQTLSPFQALGLTVNPIKLETGLRPNSGPNSAGIPYTLLLGIEAIGFPTFGFYSKPSGSVRVLS